MSVLQLQRIDSNGTVRSLNDHFNLQLIPKQQVDQSVNNDLTGNTLASEPQRGYIQRIPSSNANGVNFFEEIFSLEQPGQDGVRETSRRLSISEYDVDNAGYYEYEYFGKRNDNMTRTSFNDNDEDVEMMSDEGLLPFEFDLGGVAVEAAQPQPVLNNFMAEQFTDPLVDGADEPQRKKVKDYFKLNIFSSGGSGAAEDKKKYFWSRKKKAGLKNFEDEEVIVEETTPSVVINPSKLISNHEESVVRLQNSFDDVDDYLETEPLTQFTVFDPYVIEPGVEALAPPVVKRRSGSMPKPRGRKPSPIPDASKQFGCEYCDRRFKRQEHLKRHVRSLHMGEKPFNCTICGKKFSRSDNLNQHIKTHSHQ